MRRQRLRLQGAEGSAALTYLQPPVFANFGRRRNARVALDKLADNTDCDYRRGMSMFGNEAINRTYVLAGLYALAENLGGVFIFIYMLKSGLSTPLTLCAIAATTCCRFVMRAAVLPCSRRVGLRRTIMLGALIESLSYLLLPGVSGPGFVMFAYIAISALGSAFFWTSFHAYLAALGDPEHRGSQVSVMEALKALTGIVGPLIGGVLLFNASPFAAFGAAAFFQAGAAFSLFGAADFQIVHEAEIDPATKKFAMFVLFMDSFCGASTHFIWRIALFITLGEHFGAFGGSMALAGVAGAVMSLAGGRLIDLGHGQHALSIAYSLAAVELIAKAASFQTPWAAILANALGALVSPVILPALMTPVYNISKQSACPLRFHVITEGGWDLGCAAGCLLAAVLLTAGMSFVVPILMGLAGLGAAYMLVRPYYSARAAAPTSPH